MIVGKTIHDLSNELYIVLEEYNINKKVMQKVEDKLMDHNIFEAKQILNTSIALETLPAGVAFLVTQFLYEETNEERINPINFFTDVEISQLKTFKFKNKDAVKFPLIFENVEQLSDRQWSTKATIKEVASLYDNQLITYNFETQREAVYVEKNDGTIIKKPNVNIDSVNAISELIDQGLFFSNYITINVLVNGEDEVVYDESKKILMIKSGQLDILDGFHRSLAMLKSYHSNNGVIYITGLMITNLNVSSANAFIRQEDNRNKIDERHLKSMDDTKYANDIVKSINTDSKSDLRGKITTDIGLVNKHHAYTLTDILSESIENLYEIKTRRDKHNIEKYLIDFFNEVYAIKYNDFEDLKTSREHTMITDKNMFVFYTCLSKLLFEDTEWKNKVENILDKIDFSKNNEDWKKLKLVGTPKISGRMITKISQYIEKLL